MSLTAATKTETNTYELEIAISAGELKTATDKIYMHKRKDILVPGFRRGKAPRKVIEKMYGEGIFLEDAANDLYPAAYSAAVEEAGIEPVSRADVEMLTLDINEGMTFKATVTVKPEVTVKDYKGIEAVKTVYYVEDSDVGNEIERMRTRNARLISVEDRPAQDGDQAIIDYEGSVGGVPFEGGKGEGHDLTLGSNSFIEGFEAQVIGRSIGDEFDVNVTFPEEYHAEELAGKPAVFKVRLHEIKARELPELDDEFVKDVSEFDTMDEYKADIRNRLEEAAERRTKDEYENKLVDKVIEGLEGEIPEVMYERRIDEMVDDFSYRLQSQSMSLDIYLMYSGMDMESFRKTFRTQAERRVKISLALDKIAKIEELAATKQEIEEEYTRIAGVYQMETDKVREFIKEKDVTADLLSGRAIDLIRDSAKPTEERLPFSTPATHDDKAAEAGEDGEADIGNEE